jgi:hypothetical protein
MESVAILTYPVQINCINHSHACSSAILMLILMLILESSLFVSSLSTSPHSPTTIAIPKEEPIEQIKLLAVAKVM